MPGYIDPETMNVDDLPGVWAPVQWDLTVEEKLEETETQAQASLLSGVDVPEAILRLILNEMAIGRAYDPPEGYNPDLQGEWDEQILTYAFKTPITLENLQRERERLIVIYEFANLGKWRLEFSPEKVVIERV